MIRLGDAGHMGKDRPQEEQSGGWIIWCTGARYRNKYNRSLKGSVGVYAHSAGVRVNRKLSDTSTIRLNSQELLPALEKIEVPKSRKCTPDSRAKTTGCLSAVGDIFYG